VFLLTWSGAVPVFSWRRLADAAVGLGPVRDAEFGFDVGMTIWRVVGGFLIAAVIAVPLGIAMGAYKPIEASSSPSSPSRATCRLRPSSRC
jgi:NitT/TauT family transport system permease protein